MSGRHPGLRAKAGVPAAAQPSRSVPEARAKKPVKVRDIGKPSLQRDIGNPALPLLLIRQQGECLLQAQFVHPRRERRARLVQEPLQVTPRNALPACDRFHSQSRFDEAIGDVRERRGEPRCRYCAQGILLRVSIGAERQGGEVMNVTGHTTTQLVCRERGVLAKEVEIANEQPQRSD